ncbi:MAG: hypothetical protein M3270_00955 [Thermoproteota archaeon]|nr:hypothetical protein [Thermoproteota archaeon]
MSSESENNNQNNGSVMNWFDKEVQDGENGIIIYPTLQTFRQIYTKYVKNQLAKQEAENDHTRDEQSKPRIILIATFYETVDSVKRHLGALGGGGGGEGAIAQNIQSLIDNGSLVIVDAFSSYYPDVDGMKKLIASLSDRAKREGRAGVTAIVDMGFFFFFGGDGRATELINYEASLPPKTQGSNVKGFTCYHGENYQTLKDSQKKDLAQKGKKLFEIKEQV